MCGSGGRGGQVKCVPPPPLKETPRREERVAAREESDGSGGGSSFERYKSGMQDRNNGGSMRAVSIYQPVK